MRKTFFFMLIACSILGGCGGKTFTPVRTYNGTVPVQSPLSGKSFVIISPYSPEEAEARKSGRKKTRNEILVPHYLQFPFILEDALKKVGAKAVVGESVDFPKGLALPVSYEEAADRGFDYVIELDKEKPVSGKKKICEQDFQILSSTTKRLLTLGLNPAQDYLVTAHYDREIIVKDVRTKQAVWGQITTGFSSQEFTAHFDQYKMVMIEREVVTEAQQKEVAELLEKLGTALQ